MSGSPSRRPWIVAGILLIISAVLPLTLSIAPGGTFGSAVSLLAALSFSAAVIVFAFGWRGQGSVVAGAPTGVVALVVLAVVGPVSWILFLVFPFGVSVVALAWIGNGIQVVSLIAAVIAALAIGRSGVVPRPWNWAPAWAWGVVVATQVIFQLVLASGVGLTPDQELLIAVNGLLTVVDTAASLFIGILAIVLASRPDPRPAVEIYRAGS